MESPGELQFHSCVRGYHIYKDGDLQYVMKYSLCHHEKGSVHNSLSINAAIAARHHFFKLFICCAIAIDGTSKCDSGPSTCGENEDALKYLKKFS